MSAETYRYEHYDPQEGNSFSNGPSNSGASSYNGQGPAAYTITGTRLVPDHWWWLV